MKKEVTAFSNTASGVVSGGGQGVAVVDADAMDPRRGQHALSGARPIHLGYVELRGRLWKFSPSSAAAAASKRRSISISTVSARVPTISMGFSRRHSGRAASIS